MKNMRGGSKEGNGGDPASQLIDARIKELGDWRGETLARVRFLIKQADPFEVIEEMKWTKPSTLVGGSSGVARQGNSWIELEDRATSNA